MASSIDKGARIIGMIVATPILAFVIYGVYYVGSYYSYRAECSKWPITKVEELISANLSRMAKANMRLLATYRGVRFDTETRANFQDDKFEAAWTRSFDVITAEGSRAWQAFVHCDGQVEFSLKGY